MIRTQIQLTEDMTSRLRDIAHRRGVSLAAVVREALTRFLEGDPMPTREERTERILALAGRFDSGLADVSERHDEYFAASVRDDDLRR
jgi:predicted transcriptional regulator